MGIADFFKKGNNKPVTEGSYSYGQVGIDSFFGYSSEITEEEALEIPAVAAAVDIICGAIAQLPFMPERGDCQRPILDVQVPIQTQFDLRTKF